MMRRMLVTFLLLAARVPAAAEANVERFLLYRVERIEQQVGILNGKRHGRADLQRVLIPAELGMEDAPS